MALRSALHDAHSALGAKFSEFGGWEMPREYEGGIAEHTAVRTAVGIFDVSHLGKIEVLGAGSKDFLNGIFTNDLGRITPGQAQYTLVCDDATGGVIDDVIVYLRADDDVLMIPNAANCAEVERRLRATRGADQLAITNRHHDYVVLAVQGPRSADVLQALGLPTGHEYMSFARTLFQGTDVVVCRTGYTGEWGYELIAPVGVATPLWNALFEAGKPVGMRPCGLAARDTLRLEMGYPLHGQDLAPDITALMGGAAWAVGWDKPHFSGREALLAQRAAGPPRILRGLRSLGRGIPRAHMPVFSDGDPVGEITSGTFSPTLRTGIALALLDPSLGVGDTVVVDIRGRHESCEVVKPPFVPTHIRQ